MYIDARQLPDNTRIETDLCIIGAGAAGITIAKEFVGLPVRVCLLESGGFRFSKATQSLYQGESVGRHYDISESRTRYFGGSTNCWGGWCKPLSDIDFEKRDWVPHSGWPFSKADLDPYYRRAQETCGLGPFEYDLEYWRSRVKDPRVKPVSFGGDARIRTELMQLSPTERFGKLYRDDIGRAGNVTAYLNANVVDIETAATPSQVTAVRAVSLGGNSLHVKAGYFVLAVGGIENARLLLLSNKVQSAGLGNQHDVVGRFFMEHPSTPGADVRIHGSNFPLGLYDAHNAFRNKYLRIGRYRKRNANSVKDMAPLLLGAGLALTPETQTEERLLNSRAWIAPVYRGEETKGFQSFARFAWEARRRQLPVPLKEHFVDLITGLGGVIPAVIGKIFRPRMLVVKQRLISIVEPAPNPDSRVTLCSERDRLGLNRVRVDWRLGELEARTFTRSQQIVGEDLERLGLGVIENPVEHAEMPEADWGWHHMGTTRMHGDPKRGVVDEDCRVHGVSNLFVGGSSVFPTAGNDVPTLTIVALAYRLSDHLKSFFDLAT